MLPPEEFEEATQRFRDMETATMKGNEEYHCEEDFSNYSPWFVMDGNALVIPPWIQALPVQGQFGMENSWFEAYDTSEQCLDWWCDGPCDQYSVSCGQHQAMASLAASNSPASSVSSSEGCCAAGDSGQSTEADSQASEDLMLSLDDTRRLPVARTFLHFDTRSVVPHRRSKSV